MRAGAAGAALLALAAATACGAPESARRTPLPRRPGCGIRRCLALAGRDAQQQPTGFGPPRLRGQRRELRVGAARLGPRLRATARDRRRGAELGGASGTPGRGDPPALRHLLRRLRVGHRRRVVAYHRRCGELAARPARPGALTGDRVRLGLGHRRPAALPGRLARPGRQHRLDEPGPHPGPQRHPARPRADRVRGWPGGRRAHSALGRGVHRDPGLPAPGRAVSRLAAGAAGRAGCLHRRQPRARLRRPGPVGPVRPGLRLH